MKSMLNKMMTMSYRSKFTQDEFNAHHKEFIQNYASKYSTMDLDFKMVMFMRGCTEEEFKDKMSVYENPLENVTCSYSGLPSTQSYSWIDEENSDYDSFSDGSDGDKSDWSDDANEY